VTIDAQGFVTIKGRAKRFRQDRRARWCRSRRVEVARLATLARPALSGRPARPDPRKGERLVLVTQQKGATRSDFQAFAKSKGAADLMIPAEVVVVEKVPVLGTGKIDMVGVAKLVTETRGKAARVRPPRPRPEAPAAKPRRAPRRRRPRWRSANGPLWIPVLHAVDVLDGSTRLAAQVDIALAHRHLAVTARDIEHVGRLREA